MDFEKMGRRVAAGPTCIVINEHTNEAVRTADPSAQLKKWILSQVQAGTDIIGIEGEEVTLENIDEQLGQMDEDMTTGGDEVFSGFMVCSEGEEGSEGIAVGFSSADRQAFPMAWPEFLEEDEFTGNGDPTVYKTTGVPTGTVVKGETVVLPARETD
jgi:hypothetical protein